MLWQLFPPHIQKSLSEYWFITFHFIFAVFTLLNIVSQYLRLESEWFVLLLFGYAGNMQAENQWKLHGH